MNTPVADRVFADDEALAWLRQHAGGKIATTGAELAQRWGWNRDKLYRRVRRWIDEGVITRDADRDGKWLITPVVPAAAVAKDVVPIETPAPEPNRLPVPAAEPTALASVAVDIPARPYRPVQVETVRPRVGVVRMAGGLVLAAIACAIAWFGLNINAWYGATLGRTAEASLWLAGLSVAADVLALILPAAARTLWQDGKRIEALIAWSLWGSTIVIALMAAVGFASVNIADTMAARDRIAEQSAGLAGQVARLRSERAAIAETRSVVSIEAELQRTQPRAAAVWHATAGCTDVTRPQSGEACADVLRLREAMGTAQRRDALDADLKEAEQKLAHLPAVSSADPQAETAARLVNWITLKAVHVAPGDVHMTRVLGMTLLPQISGLVFLLALALWQPGHRREKLT
jgi:hypothetical protein